MDGALLGDLDYLDADWTLFSLHDWTLKVSRRGAHRVSMLLFSIHPEYIRSARMGQRARGCTMSSSLPALAHGRSSL